MPPKEHKKILYILTHYAGPYGDGYSYVDGIYSTLEEAKRVAEERQAYIKDPQWVDYIEVDNKLKQYYLDRYEIAERELDIRYEG